MMSPRLLLASGGLRTPERAAAFGEAMHALCGDIERVLFLPYALADHEAYLQAVRARGLDGGYLLEGIHQFPNPVAAVENARALYVGGGNTFRLAAALRAHNLVEPIRGRVSDGVPYVGVSAGTNVACPTLQTTNDMPIVRPETFETLGLVPFQINAHYFAGQIHVSDATGLVPHCGETRDERIAQYHEENETPVIGLWEGAMIRASGEQLELLGGPARLFRPGQASLDLQAGTDLRLAFEG